MTFRSPQPRGRGLVLALLFAFASAPAFADPRVPKAPLLLPPPAPPPKRIASCPQYFKRLPAEMYVPTDELHFLPPALQHEVEAIAKKLRRDALRFNIDPPNFGFYPELKPLVQKLFEERRSRSKLAVSLRARRRAVMDRVHDIQGRRNLSPETMETVQRFERGINEHLEQNAHEIDALLRTIAPLRQALGVGAILEGSRQTAREKNVHVILHHLHAAAAAQFTRDGKGKGKRFKFNSAEDGVIAGLVPFEQALSSKVVKQGPDYVAKQQALVDQAVRDHYVRKVPYRVGSLVAVKRRGTTVFVDSARTPVAERDIAYVLEEVKGVGDGSNSLIISDVDPAGFAFPASSAARQEAPESHPSLGIITRSERDVVQAFNRNVGNALERKDSFYRYMTHGAENRNPNSKGPTGYPIVDISPKGQLRVIERGPANDPHRNYRAFVEELRREGYHLEMNPLWGPNGP